jgi:error-prone DNA polymerase
VKGVRKEEMESLVAERERDGDYTGIADLASRAGVGRAGLELLAWAGALDSLVGADAEPKTVAPPSAAGGRRRALWGAGISGTGVRHGEGMQLALPLEPPEAPSLPPLGSWEQVIADYRSTGMVLGKHPMSLMRDGLGPKVSRSTDLEQIDSGRAVEVAGMVVARQRPETAKGVVFMLLEDERGTVNLVVPPPVYERYRALVRAAPFVRAKGRLERLEGTTNVLVSELGDLGDLVSKRGEAPKEQGGQGRRARERAAAELRAVAPLANSFGRGRR